MIEFKLVTQRHDQLVEDKIKQMIKMKKLEEKNCSVEREQSLATYTFKCGKRERENTIQMVANIVNDIAQEEVLERFAERYLKDRQDMSKEEKLCVKELFIFNHYMAKEEGVSYVSYYIIYIPILRELETNFQINIDGWIAFRMKKYQMILGEKIEQVIYEYKTQKEYLECIHYIVESRREQKCIDKVLHLVPDRGGAVSLYNDNKEDVTKRYIKAYCEELLEEGHTQLEDLLMHVLITVPPKTLIIHGKEQYVNTKFIATIELIFDGSVYYCTQCEFCDLESINKHIDSLYEFD